MIKPKYFVDTSAWISYYLTGEVKHEEVKEVLISLIKEGVVLSTSSDVIDETITRLITSTNIKIANDFIEFIEESLQAGILVEFFVDEQTQAEAFTLVKKFAEHKISLTDATSVVFFRRFKMEAVITLDSDFVKVGTPVRP